MFLKICENTVKNLVVTNSSSRMKSVTIYNKPSIMLNGIFFNVCTGYKRNYFLLAYLHYFIKYLNHRTWNIIEKLKLHFFCSNVILKLAYSKEISVDCGL